MAICTSMKAFSTLVEEFIKRYEEVVQDDTLEGVESTSPRETLDRMYAYRKAIKENNVDFIQAQGIVINNLEEQGKLASEVFLDKFSISFPFRMGNSSTPRRGLFKKAEFVDGGIRIYFTHKGKDKAFTFSQTSGERSTNNENEFIRIPEFGEFIDDYNAAERNKVAMSLVLGSSPGSNFKLDDTLVENSYVHGNVENMKAMLKKMHDLGGEKAKDADLEMYMGLMDKMDPKFFENLKLYVQQDAEISDGVARPSRIDIKIKGAPAAIGNQQSEASIYVEEVLHSMTSSAIKVSDKLRRRVNHLVELGRKQLTPEDFLPAPEDSIDAKAEQEFAEKLFDYIFNSKNTDYEFVAKGIAQPEVAKALSKVKVRDSEGNKTILDRLMSILSFIVDVLSGSITAKNKNQNVHDALIELAFELGEINTRSSQKTAAAPSFYSRAYNFILNDTDRIISDKLHSLTENTVGQLSKKEYEGMPDGVYDRTKFVASTIGLSLINPTYTKVAGAVASAWGLKPDGTIREIVSGLFQSEPAQKAAEFLVLQAGLVDKRRNDQIGMVRDNVLSQFRELPSKAQEEALTAIVSDTDLASLFGKTSSAFDAGIVGNRTFDNATIRKLLEDDDTLDRFIKEAKRALKDLDATHYDWHINQATGLGIYLAKHQGTPEQNLNATNIVKGIHSSHSKKAKTNVVKAVDELATLVAIKNSSFIERTAVADLMKTEWKGVQHVADIVEGFKRNSDETVFKTNTVNKIKGYSREVFDDSIIMEIAPLEDKESMEAQGFTFKGKLAPKVGDPNNKPMALYVTDSASRPERLRGGIRLNQIRAKGTTITDATYLSGEGFSNSFIRETAKRQINEIQRGAIERAQQMEKGEYDFTNTVFGVMPLLNENGRVVDYRYTMDKATKKEILKQDTRISEVMGRSFGSLLDKDASAKHNSKVLKEIKADAEENWESGTKGKDGLTDFTIIGPESSDPEMRKLFYMLPREFQEYIKSREDKTLAVRTSLKNLYFGYSQLSITDFPMLQKVTPKVLISAIKIAESIWMELVQVAKTNILMKMPTVTISNFLSNVVFLVMKGYLPHEIIGMQLNSYREIKSYNKKVRRNQELLNRKREIIVALGRSTLSEARSKELKLELRKVEGELTAVNLQIKGSRINELVEMGLDQTVEDISTNVTRDTNRISQFFDEKLEKLPSVARTGVDYLFLTKRTVPYQVVNEFLEITDLMSRDIQNTLEKRSEKRQAAKQENLPSWWLENKPEGYSVRQRLQGEEKQEFLKRAEQIRKYELVEDYINYALPSSQFEEYLNKVGILMFTKYVKRIQRIIMKTGGKGPIKSALGLFGVGMLGGLPTIHEQSFLAKEWYTDTIGPGNLFPVYSPIDIFMNVITPSLLKESTYQL